MNPQMRAYWQTFISQIEPRLNRGAVEYGDASLKATSQELYKEVEEEILDVVGWSFLLWMKLQGISNRLLAQTQECEVKECDRMKGREGPVCGWDNWCWLEKNHQGPHRNQFYRESLPSGSLKKKR